MIRLPLLAAALASALAAAPPPVRAHPAGEPAPSPQEIAPLMVGSRLPSLTVETGGGEAFDLGAAIARKPTLLIVYRGGW